ncbi:MAG: phosphotransferase family protein [Pseudomonadota bacterium]|uniref:phosphotransferase family protein n=1 Tax=unclassified Phenylobacterium TaxID=2640670 RepID=UPI0006FDF877|nr:MULTISPECIES: phosphotransferase family protein [unclassified Phenylobacterium]KRB52465.1 aminoglycoside phosphotransferase [Phenylobacterium sp. Root700]MBT9472628.1 phosphotransferase family protein [Phenylobacterium sp.]
MALEPRLATYIAARMPHASDIAVEDLSRISGGASRETYRFRLLWTQDGARQERKLILRRDPPASLIDTERRIEFEAYRAFRGSAVPVPEMLWLEEEDAVLDHPFFIAEEIAGFQASPQLLFGPPYVETLAKLGERKWTILAEIAKADPAAIGLTEVMPAVAADACWDRELSYWEGVLDEDESEPLPIIRAAIRWLRANPPPPAQKVGVVHGDYRTGNFLYDEVGGIHGILDWEMAHLGDPLEDLGWSFNPVWSFGAGMAGGLLPREQAIAIWERASGLKADPAALHWWELFNCVKGQAIWVSSARAWLDGGNREPIMVYPPWALLNAQDRAALIVMGRL